MRAVLQRVSSAQVSVAGEVVGRIGRGWVALFGVQDQDNDEDLAYLIDKTVNVRAFPDDQNKMNLSILDIKGEILAVSQFTLLGDVRKGRRPSFSGAAPAEIGKKYYERYVEELRRAGIVVGTGIFQAHMDVTLTNDGPVTILIDSRKQF